MRWPCLPPQPTCAGCHTKQAEFRAGKLAVFEPYNPPADPMVETVECEGCHDLNQPTTIEAIDTMCMDCHDDEEERFEGMLASWAKEVDGLLLEVEPQLDGEQLQVLAALREAGPLHNIEATRTIVRALATEAARPKPPEEVSPSEN